MHHAKLLAPFASLAAGSPVVIGGEFDSNAQLNPYNPASVFPSSSASETATVSVGAGHSRVGLNWPWNWGHDPHHHNGQDHGHDHDHDHDHLGHPDHHPEPESESTSLFFTYAPKPISSTSVHSTSAHLTSVSSASKSSTKHSETSSHPATVSSTQTGSSGATASSASSNPTTPATPTEQCEKRPDGYGRHVEPETADAFLAYPDFHALANNATTPSGYNCTFTDLKAQSSANNFLGVQTLTSYDVQACANYCNQTAACTGFNIFIERDPSLNPSENCTNPPSVTNYKCTIWGSGVDASSTTNSGQYRYQFQVVAAGSNGYEQTNPRTPVHESTAQKPNSTQQPTSYHLTSAYQPTSTYHSNFYHYSTLSQHSTSTHYSNTQKATSTHHSTSTHQSNPSQYPTYPHLPTFSIHSTSSHQSAPSQHPSYSQQSTSSHQTTYPQQPAPSQYPGHQPPPNCEHGHSHPYHCPLFVKINHISSKSFDLTQHGR